MALCYLTHVDLSVIENTMATFGKSCNYPWFSDRYHYLKYIINLTLQQ
jgi:hypothetical protein